MSSDIEAGRRFNDAVGATGVVGGIRADLANVQSDVTEIKADVRRIRTTLDRYAGGMVIVGSLISIAVSLVVSLFK